jgi:Mn-containing catalase
MAMPRRQSPILFVAAFPPRLSRHMLMDIATEEFSHLEIVGATITMLLDGVNGELKNAAEGNPIVRPRPTQS